MTLKKPYRFNGIQISAIRGRARQDFQQDFVQFDLMMKGDDFIPYIILFNLLNNKAQIESFSTYLAMTPILFDAKLFYMPKKTNSKVIWDDAVKKYQTSL